MIEFIGVGKKFFNGETSVEALKDITLRIPDKSIFGIIGYSGAGKSTLLRMVNRLETPTSGKVLVDGEDVSSYDENGLRSFRKKIGMIFQHFNLLENRTVEQNVMLPFILSHAEKTEAKKRVSQLLDFVGLSQKAFSYPSELSGGQKQRVGIARALALNPSVLLCDEATSALDPKTTQSILSLIQKVNAELGVTVLMITHQMNVIQSVCTHVAVLDRGRLVEQGGVRDVFGNPQASETQDFVRTIINDRLPESVKSVIRSYKGNQLVLRLRFEGDAARKSVMSDAIKETGVDISILYGTVTELEGSVIGFQTVQITGTEQQTAAVRQFFLNHNVGMSEVDL